MRIVNKYDVFDPQSQSGGLRPRPFNCTENDCVYNGGASFDTNGDILVPSSDPRFWINQAFPSSIHPRPCCFDITIAGVVDDPTVTWYQFSDAINGSYKAHYRYAEEDSRLFNLPFCDPNNPIVNRGYTRIVCDLAIGKDDYNFYDDDVFPSSWVPNYIYEYKDRVVEGRPQLYVWAITRFVEDSMWESVSPQLYEDAYVYDPPLFGNSENHEDCNPPVYFKTIIGEFKGDYEESPSNTISPISYTNECQDPKPYHGDLDLRALSFTVNPGDIWPYANDPREKWNPVDLVDSKLLCDFSNVSISVVPTTNSTIEEMTNNCGYTSYGFPFYAQESTTVASLCEEGIPYWDSTKGIAGFMWDSRYDGYMGALTENMTVTIGGVTAVEGNIPQSDARKQTCYDSDDINGTYKLAVENSLGGDFLHGPYYNNGLAYGYDFSYTSDSYERSIADRTYWADPKNVCCSCGASQSGCFYVLSAELESRGVLNEGQWASKLTVNVAGNTYEHEFSNWGTSPQPMNFNGQTVNPVLTYEDPDNEGVHDFSSATVSVTFGSVDKLNCLPERSICSYFDDRKGPDHITINIPNGWDIAAWSDSGEFATSCGHRPGEPWCQRICEIYSRRYCSDHDAVGNDTPYKCGFFQNYMEGDCFAYWFDDMDWTIPDGTWLESATCLTPVSPLLNCWEFPPSWWDIYNPDDPLVLPLEWCEGYMPIGEYMLDRVECVRNNELPISYGGCYWNYGAEDSKVLIESPPKDYKECSESIDLWFEKSGSVLTVNVYCGLMFFTADIDMLSDGPTCDYYITTDMLEGLELNCNDCDNTYWSYSGTITLSVS